MRNCFIVCVLFYCCCHFDLPEFLINVCHFDPASKGCEVGQVRNLIRLVYRFYKISPHVNPQATLFVEMTWFFNYVCHFEPVSKGCKLAQVRNLIRRVCRSFKISPHVIPQAILVRRNDMVLFNLRITGRSPKTPVVLIRCGALQGGQNIISLNIAIAVKVVHILPVPGTIPSFHPCPC